MSGLPNDPFDRTNNSWIGAAAADVAVHSFDNLPATGLWVSIQKCGRLHNLARLAVTALRYLFCDPRLLKGMIGIRGKALDRCYTPVHDISQKRLAGADGTTIEMDRTRAAQCDAAAEFRAC